MKILFIAPYQPNLIRVRPYQLIRHLSKQGHQITLIFYDSKIDPEVQLQLEKICHQVIGFESSNILSLINVISSLPGKTPLQANYGWVPTMDKTINQLIQNGNFHFDVIHIEHIRAVKYGLSIIKNNSLYPPICWDSVDSITHLFSQASKQHPNRLARFVLKLEVKRTAKFEPETASLFNQVLVTSPTDHQIFLDLLNQNKKQAQITVLPNGVDLEYFMEDESIHREEKTIVISGKMSYHANQKMVLRFVEDILPKVWAIDPEVKLWIVGKDPGEKIRSLAEDQRIEVTGWVADIRPYLQKATLAVAPLAYGAGIQNKILEAQACGTPVITSHSAIQALDVIPGQDLLASDDNDEFANLILDLIVDKEKRTRIGKNGRLYVESNHSWDAVATQLGYLYEALI